MDYLRIEAHRQAYSPSDLKGKTCTVAELRKILEDYPDDLPVVLSHDGGYTYGGLDYNDISEDDCIDYNEDSYDEGGGC